MFRKKEAVVSCLEDEQDRFETAVSTLKNDRSSFLEKMLTLIKSFYLFHITIFKVSLNLSVEAEISSRI